MQQTGLQGLRPESGIETNFRFYRKVPITKKNPIKGVGIVAEWLTIRDMLSNGIAEPLTLCTMLSTFSRDNLMGMMDR